MKHFFSELISWWFATTTPTHSPMGTTAEREHARKLHLLSMVMFVTMMLTVLFSVQDLLTLNPAGLGSLMMIASIVLALWLNRQGYLKRAALAFFSCLILVTVGVLHILSLHDPIFILWMWVPLVLPIVVSGLFLPAAVVLPLAVVENMILFFYILIVRHDQVLHLLSPQELQSFLLYTCILIYCSAIIGCFYSVTTKKAVIQADHAVELAQTHQALAEAYTEVERLASTDPITYLLNHRAFNDRFAREFAQTDHKTGTFGFIFMDLDHFKRVNDTWGHQVGDDVLLYVASCLRQSTRSTDVVARYGGEEFVILLPHDNLAGTQSIAERVRTAVAAAPFHTADGHVIPLTLSAGVASFPLHGKTIDQMIRVADTAMYQAKQTGRNRVCVASTSEVDSTLTLLR